MEGYGHTPCELFGRGQPWIECAPGRQVAIGIQDVALSVINHVQSIKVKFFWRRKVVACGTHTQFVTASSDILRAWCTMFVLHQATCGLLVLLFVVFSIPGAIGIVNAGTSGNGQTCSGSKAAGERRVCEAILYWKRNRFTFTVSLRCCHW